MSKEYKDYSTGADIYVDYQTKSVTFDKSYNPLKGDLLPLTSVLYALGGVLVVSFTLHRYPLSLITWHNPMVFIGAGLVFLFAILLPSVIYIMFKFLMCDWYVNYMQNCKLKHVPRLTVIPDPSGTIIVDCKKSGAPLVDVEFPDSMKDNVLSVSLVKTDIPRPKGKPLRRNRLTIKIVGHPIGELVIKEY